MKRILIVGGGGMVGQKLAHQLAAHGLPDSREIHVTLVDFAFPEDGATADERIRGDFAAPDLASSLASSRPDVIYLLAAIVSGDAEQNYDKGWSVNLQTHWQFLEALRNQHQASAGSYRPRVVFTSSIAVFGPPFPESIGDEFLCAPQTSYGAQKACAELMLADASRKEFVDGICVRLPTICVRPGRPNLAVSGFFSGIIREPLCGVEALLPVPDSVCHWHASPRSAAGFLLHAAALDTSLLEGRRTLNMPGVSCTVGEQIEALRRAAGNDTVRRIRRVEDPDVLKIVAGWPRNFDPVRARSLGFTAEENFDQIVQVYLEDDLENDLRMRGTGTLAEQG